MKIESIVTALLLGAACAAAQIASDASALPQDRHDGITVVADVYSNAARAKEKLGKANPVPVGILPIDVIVKNETNLSVKLNLDTIQLEIRSGSQHQDIDWLDPVEVASAIAHPGGPPSPHVRRFPLGVNIPKDEKRDKILENLKPLTLDSDIVPPGGTIHGFLFFDVGRDMALPAGSSLYVPDLVVATTNKPLMFFEVTLGKTNIAQQ